MTGLTSAWISEQTRKAGQLAAVRADPNMSFALGCATGMCEWLVMQARAIDPTLPEDVPVDKAQEVIREALFRLQGLLK